MPGVVSYLLTENSKVIFTVDEAVTNPTLLSAKTATLVSPSGPAGHNGTITWDLTLSSHNSIKGHKVVLSVDDITPTITYDKYITPTEPSSSTSVSGEHISNIEMDGSVPLCELDSGSVDGSCYYVDTQGPHTHSYTCKIAFSANQAVTSGLTS